MNVQECDGMHLKKLLKLLEQGPKAFNMVKCHPLTSNKNSINLKMFPLPTSVSSSSRSPTKLR